MLALALALAITGPSVGCSSHMTIEVERFEEPGHERESDCPTVHYTRREDRLHSSCRQVGSMTIRDSGFSTDCNGDRVRRESSRVACELGASVAVLHHQPSVASTCAQADVDLYRCDEPFQSVPAHAPRDPLAGPGQSPATTDADR